MIELGMEVMNLDGYLGVVVASPRGGKWLVQKENGHTIRVREEHMREYDREIEDRICGGEDSPAYLKWLEKRELV